MNHGFSLLRFGFKKPVIAAIGMMVLFGLYVAWALPSGSIAQGIEITRGPYLHVTTSSALVCWEANVAHPGAVLYGITSDYGSIARTDQEVQGQCVRLTGLRAYTRYHYQVWGGEVALSSDASFKTLAGPEGKSIYFVAWGDNRTNHPIHKKLADLVEEAAPDFVINVGDLVESGRRMSDWEAFFDAERELLANAPLYPTLGNHELNDPLYFSLFTLPGNERWYSFDSGPAHFVTLDVVFSAYGPGSEQYAWLERDLRETTQPWKIVYIHFPPYSFTPSRGSVEAVRQLVPLFEKYGVALVFSGHNHHYQRNILNGVIYVVTGGGGAPLHPVGTSPWTAYAEETYHFLKISIEGNVLTGVGVRLDGSEFDPFTLKLNIPEQEQVQRSPTTAAVATPVAPETLAATGSIVTPVVPAPPTSPGAAVTPVVPQMPAVAGVVVIPATQSVPTLRSVPSMGLVEKWSCRRCHDPFRVNNRLLLAYGWDFHRSFIVGVGIAFGIIIFLGIIALVLVMVRRRLHLEPNRGTLDNA
ncbi:MAG: metallophosphoesterase [Chloroflexi bacterium]|nr:metallophosphoesterase [Chloroflexota bacterium]